MHIYIRNQKGDGLIEKGKILIIGSIKRNCIFTGDNEENLILLGKYKDEETANEVLGHIVNRIIAPTEKEIERKNIFIDLSELDLIINKERVL